MHVMSKVVMTVAHWIFPMPDLRVSSSKKEDDQSLLFENGGAEGAKLGKQFSLEKNFGEIEIDWQNRNVWIRAFGQRECSSTAECKL